MKRLLILLAVLLTLAACATPRCRPGKTMILEGERCNFLFCTDVYKCKPICPGVRK